MLKTIHHLRAECDGCNIVEEYQVFDTVRLPQRWGRAVKKQYANTRLSNEYSDLCPYCVAEIKSGENDEYDPTTLQL